MAEHEPGPDAIFDVERIRRLIDLMKEHDLSQIDLRQGDQRIKLRRGGPSVEQGGQFISPPALPPAPPVPAAEVVEESEDIDCIKSPMVGTFYVAPSPDADPFVGVGDHVDPDTVVCVVEAMKVFNEIPAEISGQIIAVLAENGEPVDHGRPLFKVDKSK